MRTKEIFENFTPIEYKKCEFEKYSSNVFSQNGEDGIINEIFNRFEPSKKFFVEFGGWDGEYFSNTANLRINKSWDGILFEGDLEKVKSANKNLKIYNEYITSSNINHIFEKYEIPKSFGILSIDIDGDDAYVFESLNTNIYSPDLIVIECNPGLPNHIPLRIEEQGLNQTRNNIENGYYGANLNSLYDIAKSKNYEFLTTCKWNVFFVKNEKFKLLGVEKKDKDFIINKHSSVDGAKEWRKRILMNDYNWVGK